MSIFCILVGCQKVDIVGSDGAPSPSSGSGDEDSSMTEDAYLNSTPTLPSVDTLRVTSFPEVPSFFNNHLIVYSEPDEVNSNARYALLLSLFDFTEVYSANNAEHGDDAINLTSRYIENGTTGWEIPTADIAHMLLEEYHDATTPFTNINAILEEHSYPTLSSANNTRYLCADATKSFAFNSTTVSKAGAVRTYNLRPVKWLRLEINDIVDDNVDDDFNDDTNNDDDGNADGNNNAENQGDSCCFMYGGHTVFWSIDKNGSLTMKFIAQTEEDGTCYARDYQVLADRYSEGELIGGWRLPTEEEALYLRDTYGIDAEKYDKSALDGELNYGDLLQLNNLLDEKIVPRMDKKNTLYLCADGTKTFSFVKNTTIGKAGASTKYHVRLVRGK